MSRNKNRISPRLAAIAPSATLAVTAKAKALKAAGHPVIGFGAGEPDFPTPAHVVEAAANAAHDSKNHRYTPTKGLPELRAAIAAHIAKYSEYEVNPDHILVTNGGKQAVFQAFAAIIGEGDEVLLPAPYWTTYPEAIALAGGTSVPISTGADNQYKVTIDQLDQALTENTKALLLCSPSNPTGSIYTPEETEAIGRWALDHGIWVITDEIYQHLVYEGTFTPILKAVPELADTTIVLNGVAKTYAMTGWRVGWMHGPADVITAATNFQSHLTSNVCNVAQAAALAALTGDQAVVDQMREAFNRRRQTMLSMLREIPGFKVPEATAAFYVYPDVSALIGTTVQGQTINSTAELADLILEKAQVALVPGEAFGTPGYLRLSYALNDEDLKEGIGRLQKLFTTDN
ncbi:pyridoxal phosphate-dependent aminotransferase [Actinomycetaceae bacterium TAE3-ERU4]|nr:pyridoxal phosphate-dependent aminotransferase [Actinomycetaceae bacterium TAE3-ERU4]